MESRRLISLFIFIFFFAVLLVRLLSNQANYSFDFDEIYSVVTSRYSYLQIASGLRYDPGNPPLFFLILKLWRSLIYNSEYNLRLLSIIFYCLSFVFFFLTTKKNLSLPALIIANSLFISSIPLYFFAHYVRAYCLLLFLCLSFWYFFDGFLETDNKLKKILALFLGVVGLYTHYSFIVFLFFLTLCATYVYRKSITKVNKILFFCLWLAILYSPWAIFFVLNQFLPALNWRKYNFHQIQQTWMGTKELANYLTSVNFQNLYANLLFIFLITIFIISYKKIENIVWKKIILLFLAIFTTIIVYTPFHQIFNNPKYFIFLLPFLYFGLGIIFDFIKNKVLKFFYFLIIIYFSCRLIFSFNDFSVSENWKEIAVFFNQKGSNQIIFFHPCHFGFSFDYYAKAPASKYCFFENPEKIYYPVWNWDKKPSSFYLITYGHHFTDKDKLSQKLQTFVNNLKKEYTINNITGDFGIISVSNFVRNPIND